MAEVTTNQEQGLVKPDGFNGEDKTTNDYMNEFKGQAQEYGQKFQDAAVKAKDTPTINLRWQATNSKNYKAKIQKS